MSKGAVIFMVLLIAYYGSVYITGSMSFKQSSGTAEGIQGNVVKVTMIEPEFQNDRYFIPFYMWGEYAYESFGGIEIDLDFSFVDDIVGWVKDKF